MSYGFFDFGDDEMSEVTDEKRGKEILSYYHDYSKNTYPKYNITSVEQLLEAYGKLGPFLYENIGLTQRVNELSSDTAKSAMEKLSDAGEGKVPKNWMDFGKALGKEAMYPSFWDGLQFVAIESAKDVAHLASDVGEGVITTLKASRYLIPALAIGGAALFLYFNARSGSKAVEAIGKGLGKKIGKS